MIVLHRMIPDKFSVSYTIMNIHIYVKIHNYVKHMPKHQTKNLWKKEMCKKLY